MCHTLLEIPKKRPYINHRLLFMKLINVSLSALSVAATFGWAERSSLCMCVFRTPSHHNCTSKPMRNSLIDTFPSVCVFVSLSRSLCVFHCLCLTLSLFLSLSTSLFFCLSPSLSLRLFIMLSESMTSLCPLTHVVRRALIGWLAYRGHPHWLQTQFCWCQELLLLTTSTFSTHGQDMGACVRVCTRTWMCVC